MNFGDILGQVFRDATGMPTKVTTYNAQIGVYNEISSNISEIESSSISYFEETNNFDWRLNKAKALKLESDLTRGSITPDDYVSSLDQLEIERKQILDNFVSTTDLYFVTAYRKRLYSIKSRHMRDAYIGVMQFDSWFDMEEARELAKLASLQIQTDDRYIDAKKIAEIRDKYMYERHIRRGR